MSNKRWTCRGAVRGECGIMHRSFEAACECYERDRHMCKRIGGNNAYSDRRPVEVTI